MRKLFVISILVLTFQPVLSAGDAFLQRRGAELFLEGKPFYEISFNKFDLFWQLLAAECGEKGFGEQPAASAEKALKDLHNLGFKTIRVFCSDPHAYADPARRPKFIAAMDRMLSLCDQHDLRVVFCLGIAETAYAQACGETFLDQLTRRDAKSRARLEAYVRDMVSRYRDRKTIAMWEHSNELLLMAGIGGKERSWNNIKIPSLPEVARFHTEVAALIRSLDQRHLVTTGDSYRPSTWHLYQFGEGLTRDAWGTDSMEELGRAVAMAQKGVDVFCIHNYYSSQAFGCHPVRGPEGKPVPVNLADWRALAQAAGQPLYLGEYGALPAARSDKKFWTENPGWFESYEGADRESAAKIIETALMQVVAARPNLTHWWCYQSDRDMDQQNPQRFDIALQRTPGLVRLVVEANRKLQRETMGFTYMKAPGS